MMTYIISIYTADRVLLLDRSPEIKKANENGTTILILLHFNIVIIIIVQTTTLPSNADDVDLLTRYDKFCKLL